MGDTAASYHRPVLPELPDPGLEEWAAAYYGDNLVRLEGLKATWDPEDVFNYIQGIPLPR